MHEHTATMLIHIWTGQDSHYYVQHNIILQYSILEVGDWLSKGEGGMTANRGRWGRKEEEETEEARRGRRHGKHMNKRCRSTMHMPLHSHQLCHCHWQFTQHVNCKIATYWVLYMTMCASVVRTMIMYSTQSVAFIPSLLFATPLPPPLRDGWIVYSQCTAPEW